MSDIVMPLDYPHNEGALRELEPKLERKLRDIETGWLQDPKYKALMTAARRDVDIINAHFVWVFILTPLYVIGATATFIVLYIGEVRDEYGELKEIEDEYFTLPSFSSWLFKGWESGKFPYKTMGPVSWSFFFLICLLPIIVINGVGEHWSSTWHYFALKNDLKHIRKKTESAENRPSSLFEDLLDKMRRNDSFLAFWNVVGSVAAAFFATNFLEALLNLLAIHFVADCYKWDMRNQIINKFSIVRGTWLYHLFDSSAANLGLCCCKCFYLDKRRLTREEYEKIWSLEDSDAPVWASAAHQQSTEQPNES